LKIVLTAPATELSEYNGNPAIAFGAGFSKPWFIPREYLVGRFYKPVPKDNSYRLKIAPLGLRMIEASLIEYGGFRKDDIGIVHPDDLDKVVDNDTKIIGVSVKDPLGLGYVSLTYSTLLGMGEPINKHEFIYLTKKISSLKKKYRFKTVIGGPGVWQLLKVDNPFDSHYDLIFIGEGEISIPEIFKSLISNRPLPRIVYGKPANTEHIPLLKGGTIYGAVEITRGCGRGCKFCSQTTTPKRSISIDKILKNIIVNINNNVNKVLLVTEDIFLYGTRIPWEPNEDALKKLILSIKALENKGLEYINFTHLNLATALYRKDLIKWLTDELHEYSMYTLGGKKVLATEVGIETGSPRLIKIHMLGKAKPYDPEQWPQVVLDSLILLDELGWAPLASIIIGLPGETLEDARKTLDLIDNIVSHKLRVFLVPILFVPLGQSMLDNESFRLFKELFHEQIELFTICWKHNIRVWGPGFFDNMGSPEKIMFKIMSRLYKLIYMHRFQWRKYIGSKIYEELMGVM